MKPFAELLDEELGRRGVSPIRKALDAGLNRDAIRSVLRGRVPSVDRAAEICRALDLEFYIGPPRGEAEPSQAPITAAADPPPVAELTAAVIEAVREEMASLRTELSRLKPARDDLEDAGALAIQAANDGDDVAAARSVQMVEMEAAARPVQMVEMEAAARSVQMVEMEAAARSVQMVEMEAAAGGGAYNLDDAPVKGPVWFRRDWIDSRGIDPTRAVVISVRNDSMEPTLPAGCKILVDRNRRRRHVGHIYVITTPDGLIVKRMGKGKDGSWLLVSDSDSPDWPDVSWPDDAVVDGEVKWMAREFP